jgi:hypothetical protein
LTAVLDFVTFAEDLAYRRDLVWFFPWFLNAIAGGGVRACAELPVGWRASVADLVIDFVFVVIAGRIPPLDFDQTTRLTNCS